MNVSISNPDTTYADARNVHSKLPGRHILTVSSILLTMVIQIALWQTLPHDAFYGPDPGVKFLQVVNFSLQDQSLAYPGRSLDPSHHFVPFDPPFVFEKNKEFYGIYSPTFVGLSSFFYFLFGFDGLYIIPLLSLWAVLILTTLLVRAVAPGWQALAPLVIGLGSPLLFYALTFWEHTLGMALATGSILLFYRSSRHNHTRSGLFFAGGLAGLGFTFRPELGAWCLAMLLSALFVWSDNRVRIRIVIAFSTGVLLIIGLFQVYEWVTFGTLVRRHITNNYGAFFQQELLGWLHRQVSFMMTLLLPGQQRTLWKVLWSSVLILILLFPALRQSVSQTTVRILVLLLSFIMGGLLFNSIGSAMMFEDVTQTFPLICFIALTLVIPRTTACADEYNLLSFLFRTVVIFLVFVFLTTFNEGGGQWGPRYLLAILPAIIVIIFGCLAHMNRESISRLFWIPTVVLLIILIFQGFVMQYQGVAQLHAQKMMQQAMNKQVAMLPEQIVVIDWSSTAFVLAPVFYDKTFLLVNAPQEVEALIQMLRMNGITDFAYVSLILNREETYQLPLDVQGSTSSCLVRRDHSHSRYLRSYHQAELYVHFVVQRYQVKGLSDCNYGS